MIEPLTPPDSMYVEAAKGWCELHAYLEADAELDKVAPQLRAHPSVLEARWQVYANLEKWESALEIARGIVSQVPDWPSGWIYQASSLGELNRRQEAYETLCQAATRFPSDEIILYDLACLCCGLKRLAEARDWLRKAIEAGGNPIKLRALEDSDLEPLWAQIGEI
jgi:tetratricopeptide (TPR) repeat protein